MRKTLVSVYLFTFVITSCQDFAEEFPIAVKDNVIETRAPGSAEQDYYWYYTPVVHAIHARV